jgi:phosphoenolpyruvate-protein phosphotransferase (PTS system enzyme I)
LLVVDGGQGMLIAEPDNRSLHYFRDLQKDEKRRQRNLFGLKNKPAMTLDAVRINLNGNIDGPDDVRTLRQYDHTGVGLYRTEMLFMERNEWPTEQEQFEVYSRALRALKGHPLTIRTADLGADKEMSDTLQHGPMAHNPALGLRAIRRCLKEPHLFMRQLKAILRAGAYGPVNMMIPMLTCVSELDQVFILMDQAKTELRREHKRFNPNLPLGAMIEVPAAALSAMSFARKLDFLSIGTNDLIQYTLAMDRIDDEVSHLFKPMHPAVLKLIDMTLQAGVKTGIEVSLCGEMASDPLYTRLLLGMGLRSFSVQAGTLLEIKHIINHSHLGQLSAHVRPLLDLATADEIELAVNAMNRQFA